MKRISRPGCRVYVGHTEIPRVLGGLGINILTTPKGVMTGRQARKEGVGGEVCARSTNQLLRDQGCHFDPGAQKMASPLRMTIAFMQFAKS